MNLRLVVGYIVRLLGLAAAILVLVSCDAGNPPSTGEHDAAAESRTGYLYTLEVEGQPVAQFESARGLGSESEVIGELNGIRPGRVIYFDVVLARAISGDRYLWDWRAQVETGDLPAFTRDFRLVVTDPAGNILARGDFSRGWPSVIRASIPVDGVFAGTAIEEITLIHEGLALELTGGDSCGTDGDACDDDVDGDGVADGADACPLTPSGEPVDPDNGCSIDQLCPCEGPRIGGGAWRNHGKFVSCVAGAANRMVELRLITGAEKGRLVSAAARSRCGK